MSTCNGLSQSELARRLQAYFPPDDIEWKPDRFFQRQGGWSAVMLAYVTNRAIMARLDEVCGPGNWRNLFERWGDKGVICHLALRFNTETDGPYWATKSDGADETQIERTKGGLSSAMKRAGSQWGIGRYLYGFPDAFCPGKMGPKDKPVLAKWKDTPPFPKAFLPGNETRRPTEGPPPEAPRSPPETTQPDPAREAHSAPANEGRPAGTVSQPPSRGCWTVISDQALQESALEPLNTWDEPWWFPEPIGGTGKMAKEIWKHMVEGSTGGRRESWLKWMACDYNPHTTKDGQQLKSPEEHLRREMAVGRAKSCLDWKMRQQGCSDESAPADWPAEPSKPSGRGVSEGMYGEACD